MNVDASALSGERSNSKLAAVFDSRRAAAEAAEALIARLGLSSEQVQTIAPDEPRPGRKLEPESRGIRRTLVKSHLRLGIAGLVVGALVFAALYSAGVAMIVLSPWAALGVLLAFGATAGLMLGGLVSLRPDHDAYVGAVRDARSDGRYSVVVHAFSAEQRDEAETLLRARGGETTATL